MLTLGLAGQPGGPGTRSTRPGWRSRWSSAAFWALYIVAGSRASTAVPGPGGLAVAMTVGALALLPFGAGGAGHVAGRPHLLLLALGTAVLASVVPYTLELAALRRAPRRVFGVLLSLEPAVATLAGWVLLGQRPRPSRSRRDRRGDARERGRHPDRPAPARTSRGPPRLPAPARDFGACDFADTGGVGSQASPGSTTKR